MTESDGGGPSEALRLTSRVAEGIVVIHVDGILDATTRQRFTDYLAEAGDAYGPDMILDLSGVTFMDSRALGLIVHHWQLATMAGARYALAGVRYQSAKVMWVTGLAQRLPLYETIEDALRVFAGTAPAQDGTVQDGAPVQDGTAVQDGTGPP